MNLEVLSQKLLAAGRAHPPSDRVPYAFSKRILENLQQTSPWELGALWSRMLWRAAGPCVALAVAIGLWSHFHGTAGLVTAETEALAIPQDFERMMLAVVDEQAEELQ